MLVKRIVANVAATDVSLARPFYGDVFGLDLLIDFGWIATYGSATQTSVQITVASEGGSGTQVPDISIEVDDIEAALDRVKKGGFAVAYGPVVEPWGVKRFYVRDPFGKLVNVLAHAK